MLWAIEGECQIDTNASDFVEYTWPLTKPDQQERKITVRIAKTAFDSDTLIRPIRPTLRTRSARAPYSRTSLTETHHE